VRNSYYNNKVLYHGLVPAESVSWMLLCWGGDVRNSVKTRRWKAAYFSNNSPCWLFESFIIWE